MVIAALLVFAALLAAWLIAPPEAPDAPSAPLAPEAREVEPLAQVA